MNRGCPIEFAYGGLSVIAPTRILAGWMVLPILGMGWGLDWDLGQRRPDSDLDQRLDGEHAIGLLRPIEAAVPRAETPFPRPIGSNLAAAPDRDLARNWGLDPGLGLDRNGLWPIDRLRAIDRLQNPSPLQAPPTVPLAQLPAQRRIALVIGNANYQNEGRLSNPLNDAQDMAATLEGLGFDVLLVTDATLRQMHTALDQFYERLMRGGAGLFYYAGHGLQYEGENYLVPVDAQLEVGQDIPYETLALGQVMGRMEASRNRLNLVILDACRNNPFTRSVRSSASGLAQVSTARGMFIAYATDPNNVALDGTGRNGTFTGALLNHIQTPGLPVELVFKRVRADVSAATSLQQTPWTSSSLVGDFYFNPVDTEGTVTRPESPPGTSPAPSGPSPSPSPSGRSTGPTPDSSLSTPDTTPDPASDPALDPSSTPPTPDRPEPTPSPTLSPATPSPPISAQSPASVRFQSVPRLVDTRISRNTTGARAARYYFTLVFPAEAGPGLARIVLEQTQGRWIELESEVMAFTGTMDDRGPDLRLGEVTIDASRQSITIQFDPALPPGQTLTIGLRSRANPHQSGTYLYSLTAYPALPPASPPATAQGQGIGTGRLQFYAPDFRR